ncbi:PA domain-containing protein [Streptomyces sp. cf124]|uniref:S8 family serine peptidase n=1 Tax=Streptomyces sp. cf124 TaxID=1761903 RepID=UPI0008F3D7E0|nr:S8 family serine peptidase [Streptomyces sp. cf124]SFO04099.1 PA domain-containing protein [Streptomyces sp. cf124]
MTNHHIRPRAAAFWLTPLLAGALTLTTVVAPTHADSTDVTGDHRDGTYIVKLADAPVAAYEGGLPRLRRTAPAPGERLDADAAAVRSYVRHLDSRRDAVLDAVPGAKKLYDYDYTFNGFAARLTARQVAKLSATPSVVSVTPSRLVRPNPPEQPETATGPVRRATGSTGGEHAAPTPPASAPVAAVRSDPSHAALPDVPRFLGLTGKKGLWAKAGGPERAGEGVIVGVIDPFDPKNPMLAPLPEPRPDADVIAKKWRGSCDEGDAGDPAHKVTCNNKVIGAAYFRAELKDPLPIDVPSPLDMHSHGTHIGTTIAGAHNTPAEISGTDIGGKLGGLAPAARLAFYKTCWSTGCGSADNTAAIDRAVADGVDVISYSIGGTLTDPVSTEAMFNAAKAGVFIAASASNSGPNTVENTAPWITTVAAETHDTGYTTTLTLGDGRAFTNHGLTQGVRSAPLVNAVVVGRQGAEQIEHCAPGTLDPDKAKGKIIVCDRGGQGFDYQGRFDELKMSGAVGMVLANTPTSAQDFGVDPQFPVIWVTPEERETIKEYAARPGATAALTPTSSGRVRAPVITDFSSSGSDPFSGGDLLKPDLAAPGQLIAAGTVPGGFAGYPGQYGFMDGTSMAAPHIAGLATLLKQLHPGWSPMAIKSALMTTATTTDNEGKPIARQTGKGDEVATATMLDYGSGSPRVTRATDPGLIYDSTSADWTAYLCALGEHPTPADGTDPCATAAKTDPSDLNYPSIAIGDLVGKQTVTRTVTNVSAMATTYRAKLQTPPGFRAEVTPKRLTIAPGESASYKVAIERTSAARGTWSFGSLTLSDAHSRHEVTGPMALRFELFSAPEEVTVTGSDSATLTPAVGWKGTLTAKASLYTGEKTTGTLTGTDQSPFWNSQHTNDAVVRHRVHVPEGALFTRFAVFSEDHIPGSDLDLYAFDTEGNHVGEWADVGSDEHVDLPPGDYDVYVLQYELPADAAGQRYSLWSWKVGEGAPAVTPTVTPAAQTVGKGDRPKVTVSWPGAVHGERYVGAVEFGDGSANVGRTPLIVRP